MIISKRWLMVTNKQLEANRRNCKLGGVKTKEGKGVIRFNARKHGILSELIARDEEGSYKVYIEQLYSELQPGNIIEEMLVERMAVHYMKLKRLTTSKHLIQSDGYSHALDLRTRDKSRLSVFMINSYYNMLGFYTLEHIGTGIHLHVHIK